VIFSSNENVSITAFLSHFFVLYQQQVNIIANVVPEGEAGTSTTKRAAGCPAARLM
jgi:hypothetical protein